MATKKDINSTERLLNVIRGYQQPSSAPMDDEKDILPQQKHSEKKPFNFPKLFTDKHRFTVGVDIGRNDISFVKMTKTSDGRPLLVDHKVLKFSNEIEKGSGEFNDLLKTSLTDFAGSLENCDIWTMMGAAEVNVLHLKIPMAPKKQLENIIRFTANKENPIDEKESVFDYEIQGEINDQGVPKHSVMAYSVPRFAVEKVRDVFSAIGVQLTGITIAPFAMQNILRAQWIAVGETTFASLYVGHGFSRIDIFNKNNLMMTRGIKTGIGSMMAAIEESILETYPDKKIDQARINKILGDIDANPGKSIEDEDGIQWSERTILDMITPALERLVRQIESTLEYYASSTGSERVEKLYISSIQNVFHRTLLNSIKEQLGTASEFFDPFKGKNDSVSGASLSFTERSLLGPAIGLSLSDRKYTPNAIFTYVEKKRENRNNIINRSIFAIFAAALITCCVVLVFQAIEIKYLNVKKAKLEKELSLFNPILSKDKITALAEDLKLRYQLNQQYSTKYKGMAIISELSDLTPENIRLINVRIVIPGAGVPEPHKEATPKEKSDDIVIEGVVLGDRSELDALVAQYVMKLENSPMLQGVALQKSSIVTFKNKEILQFTINAKIGS
ncbi:MAG: pilus assembly protein PilM [Smithella sp.]